MMVAAQSLADLGRGSGRPALRRGRGEELGWRTRRQHAACHEPLPHERRAHRRASSPQAPRDPWRSSCAPADAPRTPPIRSSAPRPSRRCSGSSPRSTSSSCRTIPCSGARRSTWARSTPAARRTSSPTKRWRSSWCDSWASAARVRDILERWCLGRAELEFAPHVPAQHFRTCCPASSAHPCRSRATSRCSTGGARRYLFGPGSITVAHTPHEFIDLAELRAAVDSYMRIVRTLLAS